MTNARFVKEETALTIEEMYFSEEAPIYYKKATAQEVASAAENIRGDLELIYGSN